MSETEDKVTKQRMLHNQLLREGKEEEAFLALLDMYEDLKPEVREEAIRKFRERQKADQQ